MRQAVAIVALVSALFALVGPAEAFNRTMTCQEDLDPADPYACLDGEVPKPLFWGVSCAVYHINQTGLPSHEAPEDVYAAIRASFKTWSDVTCSYFELIDGGFTDEDRIGYNSCDDSANANIVIFRDDGWSHQRGALALTSVTYDPRSGEIVDADMELNNTGPFTFTTTDVEEDVIIDVQNTVTHEVGHFLGLDHTTDPDTTMFPTAPEGETKKRTLDEDDSFGVCAIYPSGANVPTCRSRNVGFFTAPEQGPTPPGFVCPTDRNCTCRLTDADPGSTIGLLTVLVLLGLVRRRNT